MSSLEPPAKLLSKPARRSPRNDSPAARSSTITAEKSGGRRGVPPAQQRFHQPGEGEVLVLHGAQHRPPHPPRVLREGLRRVQPGADGEGR